MKNTKWIVAALLVCGVAFVAWAAQDTTLTERELRDPKQLRPWLTTNASDAESRVAALEAGTLSSGATVSGTYTAISTNGASTNVLVTVDGEIDGEYIADDTIDNDSIDWSDMTDLTTDGVVEQIDSTAVATVTAGAAAGATAYQPNGTNLLTEGYFDVVNTTQLVFIASGVTNVIDADITTP